MIHYINIKNKNKAKRVVNAIDKILKSAYNINIYNINNIYNDVSII